MEIAVISDVHGNPLALENVLEDAGQVDLIYNLGDMVGIGPLPAETLDILIKDNRIRNVVGNHDHNTVNGTELGPIEEIPRKPHHDWVRSKLSDAHMNYLLSPKVRSFGSDRDLVFMHRHPLDWWSKVPYFYDSSPGVMDSFYGDVRGDVLFFGHTHIPLDVKGSGGRRYINPGSVGAENVGMSDYVVVKLKEGGIPSIEKRKIPYDREWIREKLREQEPPYWAHIFDHFFGPYPAGFHR